MLAEALGDLADDVEVIPMADDPSTASPVDTPLWDSLSRVTPVVLPGQHQRPVPHRRRHRRPVLPPARRHGVRLRPVQRAHELRGLRLDVPRRRRARRRRLAAAVDRPVARRRPRPPRLTVRSVARPRYVDAVIRAALFDFGGVILSSPFEAFAAFEQRAGSARRLPPHRQRHQPRHQRVGEARAQRGDARRVRRRCSRPSPTALGHEVDGRARPRPADGRAAPRDGRGGAPLRRAAQDRAAHQQLRHRRRPRRPREPRWVAVMALFDVVVESSKVGRAQARPPLLRDRVRAARDRAVRGGVPRRPRRQPQAGAGARA